MFRKSWQSFILLFLGILSILYKPAYGYGIAITSANIDTVLESNELVILNFYVRWCAYSYHVWPIFLEAADLIKEHYPTPGKVQLGAVECDEEPDVADRFGILKYPTIKFVQNGITKRSEYRGKRSSKALLEFAHKQLQNGIVTLQSFAELAQLENQQPCIVAYFQSQEEKGYDTLRKVAMNERESCHFYAAFDNATQDTQLAGTNKIMFKSEQSTSLDDAEIYTGDMQSFHALHDWVKKLCTQLVSEITFANAEEITERGLPLLILFYHPQDKKAVQDFKFAVKEQLSEEAENFSFVTANGLHFKHPISHLGKTEADLPLIIIDSLQHMFLFKNYEDIHKPGKLKQFLEDLKSGLLHLEFHFGPDISLNDTDVDVAETSTIASPPESKFKILMPSKQRYSFKKEEL